MCTSGPLLLHTTYCHPHWLPSNTSTSGRIYHIPTPLSSHIPQPDHYPSRSAQPPTTLAAQPLLSTHQTCGPLPEKLWTPLMDDIISAWHELWVRSQGCSGLQTHSMLMTLMKSQAIDCLPYYHYNTRICRWWFSSSQNRLGKLILAI